jgi:hypothetical protein
VTKAGIPNLSPDRLRHTAIATVNDATGDLRTAQEFARHADIETTISTHASGSIDSRGHSTPLPTSTQDLKILEWNIRLERAQRCRHRPGREHFAVGLQVVASRIRRWRVLPTMCIPY